MPVDSVDSILLSMAAVARCPCVASSSALALHFSKSWGRNTSPAASVHVPGRHILSLKGGKVCLGYGCSGKDSRRGARAAANQGVEKSFKTTVELDKLIDTLREADSVELPKVVLENVLSFDSPFWLRLATRADLCQSAEDAKDYEELASSIMGIVERIVKKTQEKIESSTDILKSLLNPLVGSSGEISWPPQDRNSLVAMRQEIERREQANELDESFLSEVNAQMRQAKEDGDKPGLVAMLQKVLQYYAATMLSIRSYAVKDGKLDKAEELLESILTADEDNWEPFLRAGLVYGGGQVEAGNFQRAVEKRVERTLMRTENGSYQQRVLVEYIREVESRSKALVSAFQASP